MFGRGQSKALQGALLVDRINTLAEDTRLANGFVEKDIGSFSINGRVLTYKFTEEGRPQIYAGGHKYTPLSRSYSVTLPATADRGYYVYFNVEDNSLEYQAGDPDVTNKRALLAWAYVGLNSQIIWYARETHGAGRNLDWHEAQHKNAGAIWRSGGILDVAPNRVVTISTPIVIADEDLVQVIGVGQELNQNLTMVDLPTLYWKGSAWDISTSFFMESFWDNKQTSSLTRVPNGKFSAVFILFTDNIAHPVVRVYANGYYDSADEAREASVDLIGLPMPELVPAWKVVMDSSNVVRYIDKIVGRVGGLVEMGVGGGVSDHDDLLGKDKANQHPISSITDLQTNLNNKLTRSSNLSDLTNTTTARNNLGLKGLATMNPSDLSFAATNHTHTLSSLSGTLPVNRGGTGATTAAAARTALGLGTAATRDVGSSSGNVLEARLDAPSLPVELRGVDSKTVMLPYGFLKETGSAYKFSDTPTNYSVILSLPYSAAVDRQFRLRLSANKPRIWAQSTQGSGEWVEMISEANLQDSTGQSTQYPMTQKAVTDAINAVSLGASNAVLLTGNQTIAGTKTFSSFPVTPSSAPTANYQAANKKYVDDKVASTSIGVGQTWRDMRSSRAEATTYTNTTGRPIQLQIAFTTKAGGTFTLDGTTTRLADHTGAVKIINAVIPAGGIYRLAGWSVLESWLELR